MTPAMERALPAGPFCDGPSSDKVPIRRGYVVQNLDVDNPCRTARRLKIVQTPDGPKKDRQLLISVAPEQVECGKPGHQRKGLRRPIGRGEAIAAHAVVLLAMMV